MAWYALQLKPGQGDRALDNLQNQSASCFYPKITIERFRAGKRVKKLEPLFPGYLFINIEQTDPLWAKLRSTRGVLRVVSFANTPASIDDSVINHIRDNLLAIDSQGGIKPGHAIDIEEGPFKGLSAIFKSYDGDERAIVLIEFMQKQQVIKMPLANIRKSNS